jgi:hypothetical protein
MLWSTFLLALILAHITLGLVFLVARPGIADWVSAALALVSTILFALVALSSETVETVANNGDVVTTSEPGIGIYAFGLALISFLLTVVLLIEWLPTQSLNGGSSSGF